MITNEILRAGIDDTQGESMELNALGFVSDERFHYEQQPQAESEYKLDVKKLESWLSEIRNQPKWRPVADIEDDYFDGNQIDAETQAALDERGQSAIVDNQIGPVIRTVLGMQAKSRMDTVVKPEAGETNVDVASALGCKLKEYSTMCAAQQAKSDCYAEMMKVGVSCLEVGKSDDPFGAPFSYQHVHRREVYWDWRAKSDLSDARYFVRRKWVDEDQLIIAFPDFKQFIQQALGTRATWDIELMTNQYASRGAGAGEMPNTGFGVSVEQYEWMNITRKRLLTYEVWYRVKVRGMVFKMPNGKAMEYDKTNPTHVMLAQSGIIKPFDAMFDRIRVAFFIGPKCVGDYASPYKHKHFPYILMFCFRENRTNVPYGIIRSMISPQNEINARKTKMLWLLNSKLVKATKKAVDDHAVAANEAARPDGYVITNNLPGESFEIHENQPMASQQFQVMTEAKETLQTAAGIHNATLGRQSGATSGLAINSLVEQDAVSLAEPNDNFNMACRRADTILLELIIEELSEQPNTTVKIEDEYGKEKEVVINKPGVDPVTGAKFIENDITKIDVSIVLADAPLTATFRNQVLLQMTDAIKGLPPEMQAQLAPDMIMAGDAPNKANMAKKLMKMLGQTDDGEQVDPEKEKMKQMIEQGAQTIKDLQDQLRAKNPPEIIAATVKKLEAEVELLKSRSTGENVKSLYSSMQSAQAVVANPSIVPVADQISKSSGFTDKDGGTVVGQTPMQESAEVNEQLGPERLETNEVPLDNTPQTNPTSPNLLAQPMQAGPQSIPQVQQAPSPGQGLDAGIEQPGNQV
jgi:hypothetical protein